MKPEVDLATFKTLMAHTGLSLSDAQVAGIYEGYGPLLGMLERINRPLPREAEPALTFDPENF